MPDLRFSAISPLKFLWKCLKDKLEKKVFGQKFFLFVGKVSSPTIFGAEIPKIAMPQPKSVPVIWYRRSKHETRASHKMRYRRLIENRFWPKWSMQKTEYTAPKKNSPRWTSWKIPYKAVCDFPGSSSWRIFFWCGILSFLHRSFWQKPISD